jgi:hypothetical protein
VRKNLRDEKTTQTHKNSDHRRGWFHRMLVIWCLMWATNLLIFKGVYLAVDFVMGGLVLVLVYIGLIPALMPGNIGPFYFFCTTGIEGLRYPH